MAEPDGVTRLRRMIADRITDDMLTKPVAELTEYERQLLASALTGPHADEIMRRMVDLVGDSDPDTLTSGRPFVNHEDDLRRCAP